MSIEDQKDERNRIAMIECIKRLQTDMKNLQAHLEAQRHREEGNLRMYLTAAQLRQALDYVANEDEPQQERDTDVAIERREDGTVYCWLEEYPEEGSVNLI